MAHGDGGKGSGRRKEDSQAVRDGWDRIFGRKSASAKAPKEIGMKKGQELTLVMSGIGAGKTQAIKETIVEHDEDNEDYSEDGEWTCDMCGGPMYRQPHWDYGQCDDCGARQELINDDYT